MATTTNDSSTESSTNWWDAAVALGSQYFSSKQQDEATASKERLAQINATTTTELARINAGAARPVAQTVAAPTRQPQSVAPAGSFSFGNINLKPFVLLGLAAFAFKKFI